MKYELHDMPDPLAAAAEMARRGYDIIVKKTGSIYPNYLPGCEILGDQWKDPLVRSWSYNSWKELCGFIKTAKLKYRRPIPSIVGGGYQKFVCERSGVYVLT